MERPLVQAVCKIHALRDQQNRLIGNESLCRIRSRGEALPLSVSSRDLSDSASEITACQTLMCVLADLLRKHHHLIFIVVNRVAL